MCVEALNHSITPTAAAVLSVGMDLEDSNPSTTAAAVVVVEADDLQMPLNSIETVSLAVQSPDMDPDSLNSAAAEAVIPPPSPLRFVDNFGHLTKKPASNLYRFYIPLITEEHYSTYLAQTLVKLYSSCRSATSNDSTSDADATVTSSTDINNEAKTDLLDQHGSYVCTICNKSFTTYQALRGHKASHRNKPIEKASPSASAVPINVSAPNPSSRAHVCSVCHKAFTSGQALGGHKRKHYEGQIGSTVSGGGGGKNIVHDFLGQIGTTSGGGDGGNSIVHDLSGQIGTASGGGRGGNNIIHDFDLNLLPQSEFETEEGLNVDSEMKTEVDREQELNGGRQPNKKSRFTIDLVLQL